MSSFGKSQPAYRTPSPILDTQFGGCEPMAPERRESDLSPSEAGALRQATSDTYAALQLAHLRYEHALAIAADASPA